MQWEVDTTLIDAWLDKLDAETYRTVFAALEYLEDHGPTAGRPFVDRIHHSKHQNMKELRPRKMSDGRTYRILFVFDPRSRAISLVAGDKTGNWEKWYRKNVPVADDLYDEHLAKLAAEQDTERKGKKR